MLTLIDNKYESESTHTHRSKGRERGMDRCKEGRSTSLHWKDTYSREQRKEGRKLFSTCSADIIIQCGVILYLLVTDFLLIQGFLSFLLLFGYLWLASLIAQLVKNLPENNLPAMQETPVQFLGQENMLEKG